ncbi:hypothetical protein NA57DRAFT_80526 [Rhizodiscina lignyota]|uniref:Endo-1,3(4)-beta-glucanase 1 carbohydrate binding domain-containing protein n=1 Tax=Rhizodiscina lignyota TaxID=1504668 RepID=A0A9P4M4A9_9PEZI|nr:hypothetical protein NA57DRAFT_80526 [Rhizodiscina lignyota]
MRGNQLCPIIDGTATQPCGTPYGCYNPGQLSCDNGTLTSKPVESTPYTLVVRGGQFDGRVINACSQAFYIRDLPCTYCPDVVPQQGGVCPDTNQTVLSDGDGLYVEVPGGQLFYVNTNGALGYTQAHSGSFPQGAVFGVTAYEDGEFILPGSDGWVACVGTSAFMNPGSQIYAKLPGLTFSNLCYDVAIWTVDWNDGPGAWQYT